MKDIKKPLDVKIYILLSTLLLKAEKTEDLDKLLETYTGKILKLFEEET